MVSIGPPFDWHNEEQRLNLIFAQLADDFSGVRNNAATAIHDWMHKNPHNPGVRLVIAGTSAERTWRAISELETRLRSAHEEIKMLREHMDKSDLRNLERRKRASVGNHVDEFITAIIHSLYQGRVREVPRGSSKIIAGILACSESTVRSMLRGLRPVTTEEVDKIRRAPPVPAPRKSMSRGQAKRGGTSKRSKRQFTLEIDSDLGTRDGIKEEDCAA